MAQKVRLALIGCGEMAERIASFQGAKPDVFESVESLLEGGTEFDAAEVCTPNWEHHTVAAQLERKMFVWVEAECRKVGRQEDVLATTPLPDDLTAYEDPSKFEFNLPDN